MKFSQKSFFKTQNIHIIKKLEKKKENQPKHVHK